MMQDVDVLKVLNLNKELRKIGQSTTGKKAPLVERLKVAIVKGVAISNINIPREACINRLGVSA